MIKDFDVTRFEIAKLELRPGDKLVVRTELFLTKEQTQRIKDLWKEIAPDHETIVLTAGLTVEVLRTEP
ncbi:hypothetical protein KIP88_02970 [Bradyrhizobium sp. SRL28]|uniref:hypothetical protein n=1 Tax=Bradyrhizobium sp. SRL28 TaxID=2836178 RepID=UPI001BDF4433|nr:hypothetical protein [Bradyrhizobium sp. SRL28]MBT1509454.1 hypothetical protein [Bradyrhizobium sp. SRL28]